jgi:hypothetical protein
MHIVSDKGFHLPFGEDGPKDSFGGGAFSFEITVVYDYIHVPPLTSSLRTFQKR